MADDSADPLVERLRRMSDLANQQATMHSWLSDRYGRWNLALTIATLVFSALLLAFVFTPSGYVERTTGVPANAFKWTTGMAAVTSFSLTLVGLAWQPAARATRHDQAVRHYTKAKYEIRRQLESGGGAITPELIEQIQERYLDDRDLPRIEERRFLKLKRWHQQKVAISRELSRNPHESVRSIKRRLRGAGRS